jgi:site-specific recombinase XerD
LLPGCANSTRAEIVGATSHDLREYRARLAERQKPASVNAALAALQRFYGWARDTGRTKTNPTANLKASPASRSPL